MGFILLTLVVAVAATNTGNNGLYILVSLFLGALVVSGVVSRRNVENVAVELDGPPEIFAGVPGALHAPRSRISGACRGAASS